MFTLAASNRITLHANASAPAQMQSPRRECYTRVHYIMHKQSVKSSVLHSVGPIDYFSLTRLASQLQCISVPRFIILLQKPTCRLQAMHICRRNYTYGQPLLHNHNPPISISRRGWPARLHFIYTSSCKLSSFHFQIQQKGTTLLVFSEKTSLLDSLTSP